MKPTTTLLVGGPLSGHEARLLRRLYADLEPTGPLILANFHVDQRQIDFVVVTESYAAILEQKQFPQPVFGRQNGQWSLEDGTGAKVPYSGQNPWQQALQQKYALSDEMNRYEQKAAGGRGASRRFFTEFDAFVCIVPAIHPRSDVTPGDGKVAVRSYADLIDFLRSAAKPASWTRADWSRFATEHLGLMPLTLEEAIDPKVRTAADTLRGYLSRVETVLGYRLPPLLPATADSSAGQALVDAALAGENHLLVGPSGSAKTFHLHHIATAAARRSEEVPILVEARTYRGGDFWPTVRRGVAPMFRNDPKELLEAIRLCSLRPLLLVDALNECPPQHQEELLRGVQTFVLHFGARVILTGQELLDLPLDLKAEVRELKTPSPDQKRHIYCHHAGIEASPAIDHLCEGFTNAYDLTIAGRCHASGAPAVSRADLYDRYVRSALLQYYHVATALLRAVASEMAGRILSSWARADYELFAERFLTDQGASVAVLDELRHCRFIRLTEDFFAFEHDLLADYFNAGEVLRRLNASADLATELGKPRNQRLIELVLPRLSEDHAIDRVLSTAMDLEVLDSTLAGHCGERARAVLLAQTRTLFTLAAEDLSHLTFTCYIAQLDDGRRRLGSVVVDGDRAWSSYSALLCKLVAHHLDVPDLAAGFLELLDITEYALKRGCEQAAADQQLKRHRVWEETVRLYAGVLVSSAMSIPCTAILGELRSALMDRKYPNGLPIAKALLARSTATPGSHFALLALFQDREGIQQRDFETNLDLVRRGWESDVYILKVDALEFLRWMRRGLPDEAVSRVCEMLSGLETDNIMENTARLDALSAYGGVEPPVAVEDAFREMRGTIAADALSDPAIMEAARAFGTDPGTLLATRAIGCLNNIFEDIFQGAYSEAYSELSREEKCAILSRAAEGPDVRFHSAWLVRELIEHGGRDGLGVYERFASGIDGDSSFAQDATAAFLLAIEACARWSETAPRYTGGDSPPHRAWAIIGELFFWTFRQNELAQTLWAHLQGPTRLATADVLYNIRHCAWQLSEDGRPSVDLLATYPQAIRPIIEDCIRQREALPTVFGYGGSRNRQVVPYLIDVLGTIGNENSARLLEQLVDDLEFGRDALRAIDSIRRRAGQPAQ